MIMNRLSMNNLTEPVTKDLEFQLQDPFLLYKTAQSIYGLWFYDRTECQQVSRLMESLVYKAKKRAKGGGHRSRSVSESDAGPSTLGHQSAIGQSTQQVDIMQMLSRAQHEYNKTQQDDKIPVSSPKPKSPPRIASESPTVLRPVPVKPEDGTPDQNSKQTGMVSDQPTTNKVIGPMSRGPSMHPGFQRSVSMQGSLGYLSGNSIMSSGQAAQVPEMLQKLLSNAAGESQRVMPDHPLSNRQVHTVESLERRHDNQTTSKKSPESDSSQGSAGQGQGSRGQMMTVESLEQQHTGSTTKENDSKSQGYPIQNLLAQLSIAQRTGKHETTEGSGSSMSSSSKGHSSFAGSQKLPSGGGDHGHYAAGPKPKAEDIVGQPNNPDMNQKLLTSTRSVIPTSQPSPLQFIQPSSIQPNVHVKPKGSREPVQFTGNQGVRSLQQIALGGVQFGQMRPNTSNQTTTNGVTTHTPVSPQRIPGSLLPPTLLTPQAFRKRASSETVVMASQQQLYPPVLQNVVVQSALSSNQQAGGHLANSVQHNPLLNRVEPAGRVNSGEILNKEQFKQAFVHLLQSDSSFLSSLHNAYLQTVHHPPI
ncbi:mRNA-decapping enzyme 1B-like [Asterias rubens]|uniref:mRNA-decapping enzyme 1B-like n=1 Tax=Asterias rubens TaxID=7604 RepID=UPI0014550DD7|nr:mRNA-decapping enzyme 1B-like [Asterias rubens]